MQHTSRALGSRTQCLRVTIPTIHLPELHISISTRSYTRIAFPDLQSCIPPCRYTCSTFPCFQSSIPPCCHRNTCSEPPALYTSTPPHRYACIEPPESRTPCLHVTTPAMQLPRAPYLRILSARPPGARCLRIPSVCLQCSMPPSHIPPALDTSSISFNATCSASPELETSLPLEANTCSTPPEPMIPPVSLLTQRSAHLQNSIPPCLLHVLTPAARLPSR